MSALQADNTVYDQQADSWWNPHGFLNLLRYTVNPWRVPYFRRIIADSVTATPLQLLDVGCGGGLLAEEFARMGCSVTGIDPSEPSLATARAHAISENLDILYRQGFGDRLPFADAHFDFVSCCDVLEHIQDWDAVIAEIARVLKPGGVFLFDTINRTFYSWLVNIQVAQVFPPTRFLPRHLHVWNMFIKPQELRASLTRHGFGAPDFVGSAPGGSPLAALGALRRFRSGGATAEEVGRIAALHPSRNLLSSYMGHARRAA